MVCGKAGSTGVEAPSEEWQSPILGQDRDLGGTGIADGVSPFCDVHNKKTCSSDTESVGWTTWLVQLEDLRGITMVDSMCLVGLEATDKGGRTTAAIQVALMLPLDECRKKSELCYVRFDREEDAY